MTPEDLETWRQLTIRCGSLAQQLEHLTRFAGEDGAEVIAEIATLEALVGALTIRVQVRVFEKWTPVAQPPIARPRPPAAQSTEIVHDVPISRYDLRGRPAGERDTAPPISGRWASNRRPGTP